MAASAGRRIPRRSRARPPPIHQDPAHPYVGNNNAGKQPTYRIGDVSNPNLKQWAKDVMTKDNAEVLAGKIAFTARSSCLPAGVPGLHALFGGQPIYFVQTPKKVWMIYEGDHQVRHVYMDVAHSANPKPSWYGESVGRYEGDTLVIDTIGMNTKTVVDSYRTPHTEKLHVVERWRLIEGGKTLEVNITVEDPDTFNKPWSTVQRYQRGEQTLQEEVCAENNGYLFDYKSRGQNPGLLTTAGGHEMRIRLLMPIGASVVIVSALVAVAADGDRPPRIRRLRRKRRGANRTCRASGPTKPTRPCSARQDLRTRNSSPRNSAPSWTSSGRNCSAATSVASAGPSSMSPAPTTTSSIPSSAPARARR